MRTRCKIFLLMICISLALGREAGQGEDAGVYITNSAFVDLDAMVESVVTQYTFAANRVLADGSIELVPELNASFIKDFGEKAGQDSKIFIGVRPRKFLQNPNSSLRHFRAHAQLLIDTTKASGVMIDIHDHLQYPESEPEWRKFMGMMEEIRSLRSPRGDPVMASFMFSAESFDHRVWTDLKTYQPCLYADSVHVALFAKTVDPKQEISFQWAIDVVGRIQETTAQACRLSLMVTAIGKPSSLPYRELIKRGAFAQGNGQFNNVYYNSQTQIQEKASLVRAENLLGLSIVYPLFDLPPQHPWSLVSAMVAAL